MHFFSVGKKLGYVCVLFAVLGLTTGCAKKGEVVQPVQNDELAAVTTMVESYGDIELPLDMTLVSKKSMAMRTDSFQGGIHVYQGRVEISSLRDYIIASMRNHKWKLVGEATYNNVMLAFTKPNKTCMVVLENDSIGKTHANFYVTVDVAAANRLNPFGEPINQ
ncbi:MAG: hypothetical protein GY786_14845 [Proteobacteria bacterium]|nr:hypothetical protein [Desulfobulbaceae bacterium]MCP4296877.1 hypothetical protein [Pseudomonadota bacterium]